MNQETKENSSEHRQSFLILADLSQEVSEKASQKGSKVAVVYGILSDLHFSSGGMCIGLFLSTPTSVL